MPQTILVHHPKQCGFLSYACRSICDRTTRSGQTSPGRVRFGPEPLNRYLRERASQDVKRRAAGFWVLVGVENPRDVIRLLHAFARKR